MKGLFIGVLPVEVNMFSGKIPPSLRSNAAIVAIERLDKGPANEILAVSSRGLFRLYRLIGTGFAHPKVTVPLDMIKAEIGIMIVPTESM